MSLYGPPTAQEHLRSSIHGSINYTNRAPMCCPEGVETDEVIERRWPILWSVIAAMVAGAAVWVAILWALGWLSVANAAEPADHMRPHEITLVMPPAEDRPGIITISAAYPDRAACEKAMKRVTVKAPGGKLVCGIVNPFRVR